MTAATIRHALPREAKGLSELAMRSKAVWGYSPEFMAACREELTVSSTYVRKTPTFVLDSAGQSVGFYALERLSESDVELGFLFVEPEAIGRGHGRALIQHAKHQAREMGYARMVIQGDPNAEGFYRAAGGRLAGTMESLSIPGRLLPLFHVELIATSREA